VVPFAITVLLFNSPKPVLQSLELVKPESATTIGATRFLDREQIEAMLLLISHQIVFTWLGLTLTWMAVN
jgi:hypothetical protein